MTGELARLFDKNEQEIFDFIKEYTKELICFHDPTGTFEYVFPSVNQILGYMPEELIGKSIYSLIHEEDREFFEMIIHLPLLSGNKKSLNADIRLRKSDNAYIWMNIDIIPLKDDNGLINNMATISRDVTEYTLMKEKYEKKEALLSDTGQMAQLGAWEFDVVNKSMVWSKETFDIFEIKDSRPLPYPDLLKHFPGEASKAIETAHKNAIEHGIPFNLTLPFITLKGRKIWVRAMATPKIHMGKVVKLYGVIQNIDKDVNANLILKSMVKQLTKQNRQLEDFTHILSHNVRGPIASLSTLLNMLEEATTPEERNELMDMLKLSSKSLEDLLQELKEVINATHIRGIESQENDIKSIINYSKELLQGEILQSKAQIVESLDGWQKIFYPKIYLESIIMNFMSNALKYKADDRDPIITIQTLLNDGLYILKFSDNGSGIDLSIHGDNMFKLYKTFHPKKPGKGLGLFMTKSQIEAMGGELGVESELNSGTIFTVVFNKEKTVNIPPNLADELSIAF